MATNKNDHSPIETERLLLRELDMSDIDAMLELDSSPEVHRYIDNALVTSRAEIAQVISFLQGQYRGNAIGRPCFVR